LGFKASDPPSINNFNQIDICEHKRLWEAATLDIETSLFR